MSARIIKAGSLGILRRSLVYIIIAGTWITGGVWLIYHYFLVRQGEFGPETNPLEPWSLRLHGAFAFAAIWIFGLLWPVHIAKLWPHARRRWSGGTVTALFLALIISGYLLYYVGDERIRPSVSEVHWITGVASPIALLHRIRRRKITRNERELNHGNWKRNAAHEAGGTRQEGM
jgi:hypothetical protein